jgi:membrane associated rhomboid family serine protease
MFGNKSAADDVDREGKRPSSLRPTPAWSEQGSSSYVTMDEGNDRGYGSSQFSRQPLPPSIPSNNQKKSWYRRKYDQPEPLSGPSISPSDDSPSSRPILEKQSSEEIYIVSQQWGYLAILFSLGQTIVLAIMMIECGVAPFQINPMIGPYPDALSDWGAKNAVNILEDGEWWRVVTPIMLHAGVIHLVCNVAVQLESGAFFEREWGSLKWLIIYLSSAVGSSILSVIFMPQAISVGSSGAVMGLFGAKLAEVICRLCESDKTKEERVAHQVRKEQCAAVTCSVTVVMLFSFIPYGKYANSFFTA